MVRISNGIITLLNLGILLVSLCAISFSVFLYVKVDNPCERALRSPLLIVGGSLLLVSMMGLLGSCCRVSFFMFLYLTALFLLILGLIAFTIFAIVVTNKTIGDALSGAGNTVGAHQLAGYSRWLQKNAINEDNWDEIKSCMVSVELCHFIDAGNKDDEVYKKLSPIQRGCCRAPNDCQNATTANPDCKTWSNDPTRLCFDCDSCKTAALENIRREWRTLAIFNSCILLIVTIIYSIGCCALRNN